VLGFVVARRHIRSLLPGGRVRAPAPAGVDRHSFHKLPADVHFEPAKADIRRLVSAAGRRALRPVNRQRRARGAEALFQRARHRERGSHMTRGENPGRRASVQAVARIFWSRQRETAGLGGRRSRNHFNETAQQSALSG